MAVSAHTDSDGIWLRCTDLVKTPEGVERIYDHFSDEERAIFDHVCANLACPKEFITRRTAEYGWSSVMIENCTFFTPAKLPRPVRYHQPNWRCYETSIAYAQAHDLRYIEGIAVNPTGAMIHAWCSTDGKDVIDLTWPYQHVNKYFGHEFDIAKLKQQGYPHGGVLGYLEKHAREKAKIAQTEAA